MNEFQVPPPLAPTPMQSATVLKQPAPWEPKPLESPVETALLALDSEIANMQQAVASLIDRLAPALAPVAPQAPTCGSVKPSSPPCSELVHALNAKVDTLIGLAVRVGSITARVEL